MYMHIIIGEEALQLKFEDIKERLAGRQKERSF
jgi:hypothetical protein